MSWRFGLKPQLLWSNLTYIFSFGQLFICSSFGLGCRSKSLISRNGVHNASDLTVSQFEVCLQSLLGPCSGSQHFIWAQVTCPNKICFLVCLFFGQGDSSRQMTLCRRSDLPTFKSGNPTTESCSASLSRCVLQKGPPLKNQENVSFWLAKKNKLTN